MIILLSVLSAALCIVGSIFAGFGMSTLMHTSGKKVKLWGITVPVLPKIKRWRVLAVAGWVMICLGGVVIIWNFGLCTWAWEFPWYIWLPSLVGALIPTYPSTLMGRKWLERTLAQGDNALILGQLRFLQVLDDRISSACVIAISMDRICLYDARGYLFHAVYYRHCLLPDLINEEQLILLGYYFRQKYRDSFVCKPCTNLTITDDSGGSHVSGWQTKRILFERISANPQGL